MPHPPGWLTPLHVSIVSPAEPTSEGLFQWPVAEDNQGLMLVR